MTKLTDLTAAPDTEDGDFIYLVDVSDTSEDPAGSSRKVAASVLRGSPITVMLKEKIAGPITDPVGGAFEFLAIPSGYGRLFLVGEIASDRALSTEIIDVSFNGDDSTSGYMKQNLIGERGAINASDAVDDPQVTNCIGGTAIAGQGPSRVEVIIQNASSPFPKVAMGFFQFREQSDEAKGGFQFIQSPVTDVVASVKLRSGTASTLTGTMALYGEREATIYVHVT